MTLFVVHIWNGARAFPRCLRPHHERGCHCSEKTYWCRLRKPSGSRRRQENSLCVCGEVMHPHELPRKPFLSLSSPWFQRGGLSPGGQGAATKHPNPSRKPPLRSQKGRDCSKKRWAKTGRRKPSNPFSSRQRGEGGADGVRSFQLLRGGNFCQPAASPPGLRRTAGYSAPRTESLSTLRAQSRPCRPLSKPSESRPRCVAKAREAFATPSLARPPPRDGGEGGGRKGGRRFVLSLRRKPDPNGESFPPPDPAVKTDGGGGGGGRPKAKRV